MSTHQKLDNGSEVLSVIGKNLYLNSGNADVHFIFESSDERVPAHKIILSSGSDVFDAMFYGSLKEDGDIKIVDSTASAFKEFLRFFYFNKVDVSMEHVSEVMYLGRKYNVAGCHRLCVNLLEVNITDQTVICALGLAIFYEQQQLQKLCETFIASYSDIILQSDSFLSCDSRVLEHILKMDNLTCSEAKLFEGCMSWVRIISEKDHLTRDIVQNHLGYLFYEIRFGAMTSEEFAKILLEYGELFSTNEYCEIIQVISGQERKSKIFKTSRVLPDWNSDRLILCNRFNKRGCCDWIQAEDVTKFSTNARLLLGYFSIIPIFDHRITRIDIMWNINATIIANSSETLAQFDFSFVDNGYKVDIPTPISIRPGIIYEIRLKFPTNESLFSDLTFHSTVEMEKGIVVRFHNEENSKGQIVGAVHALGFNLLNGD